MGKVEEIMKIRNHDEREIKLRKYAKSLGCSLHGTYTSSGIHVEHEVIKRIREAESSQRGRKQFLIVLITVIITIIGVIAAWIAALK